MFVVRHQEKQITDGRLQRVDHVGSRQFSRVGQYLHERGILARRVLATVVQVKTIQKFSVKDLKWTKTIS